MVFFYVTGGIANCKLWVDAGFDCCFLYFHLFKPLYFSMGPIDFNVWVGFSWYIFWDRWNKSSVGSCHQPWFVFGGHKAPFYYKSSHQRCSVKKGILKNFTKFTGKHLCQSLFLNKVAWPLVKLLASSFI